MTISPGTRFGSCEILGPLGAGGMGEVYRARHVKLRREVAIKVLPAAVASDPDRLARMEREARSASALNHPNVVTIHDIAEHEGTTYIAMELVQGRTLRELIDDRPLPVDRVLRIATQVADGLAKAHAAGIIHRDIKPANIMVTPDGLVKILDFGLAKPVAPDGQELTQSTLPATGGGPLAGTPHYMSPEQWSGGTVDHRSDQFAFGAVLYELCAGVRPFDGPTFGALMAAVLTQPTPRVRRVRRGVPADLERITVRALEKDPDRRFDSMIEVGAALRACADRRARARRSLRARLRRPAVAVALGVVLLLGLSGGALWVRSADERWAHGDALAEITARIEAGEIYEAHQLGLKAARYRGEDAALAAVLDRISWRMPVSTEPQGAEVWVKGYTTPDAPWERVGVTPLTMRVSYASMRWRITKEGYEPVEGAPFSGEALGAYSRGLVLDPVAGRRPGMVRVPAGPLGAILGIRPGTEGPLAMLDAFYLDRYEATNRQYAEFVRAGGYRNAEWWPSVIERDGVEISWEAAVEGLVDATGRPGPSGWELSRYPEGEADYPVSGISWYEAAAYCAFAGKSLPTLYHWFHAVGQRQRSEILGHSNLSGDGPAPVGRFRGLAAYGTYDMAGNVREWAWNASGDRRYILGGAWNEPTYIFVHPIAADAWDRAATNGVRCASYLEAPPEALTAPVTPERAYRMPEPMDADAFELVRGLYAYDRDSLDARLERVNDSLPHYRRETVSVRTAYSDERMEVHLLIPHDAVPPYQSVVWFPGGDVYVYPSSEQLSTAYLVDFIPRTGRVLVQPVLYGMYERLERPRWESPEYMRDLTIRWAQDLGRTLDYLETRPDFDSERIALYGLSNGAVFGPIFTAVEPRFATSILLGGGLIPVRFRPEANPAAFAPWSRTPTLLVSGRDDFMMPYEESQRPLFELLGVPEADKRHARLAGGHLPSDRHEVIREVLDWLDSRLGPVQSGAAAVASAGGG